MLKTPRSAWRRLCSQTVLAISRGWGKIRGLDKGWPWQALLAGGPKGRRGKVLTFP